MTPRSSSSTLLRRRLSRTLRARREEAGLTLGEVAKAMRWSPGRLGHWENDQLPKNVEVELIGALLTLYGVTGDERDEILELVRECRTKGWWADHKEITPAHGTYIGFEAAAEAVCIADLVVFPGLLQTEAYARAIMEKGPVQLSPERLEQRLAVRMKRQELITRSVDPLRVWTVVDEAALHRQIGGPAVMRDQLDHVRQLAELSHITVQVVPYKEGAHPATANAFVIFQFPGNEDPDIVYTETLSGELFTELPSAVARYHVAFRALQADAPNSAASIKTIAEARKELAAMT